MINNLKFKIIKKFGTISIFCSSANIARKFVLKAIKDNQLQDNSIQSFEIVSKLVKIIQNTEVKSTMISNHEINFLRYNTKLYYKRMDILLKRNNIYSRANIVKFCNLVNGKIVRKNKFYYLILSILEAKIDKYFINEEKD